MHIPAIESGINLLPLSQALSRQTFSQALTSFATEQSPNKSVQTSAYALKID
jgi:hypothetical protein